MMAYSDLKLLNIVMLSVFWEKKATKPEDGEGDRWVGSYVCSFISKQQARHIHLKTTRGESTHTHKTLTGAGSQSPK